MSYGFADSLRAGSGRHVSDGSSVHHQEFFTVHIAVVYVLRVCWQLASRIRTTCFGRFLCPSSGVFHCTHNNGICRTCLLTACEQDQDDMFRTVPLPIIRSFSRYTQQWYMSYRYADSLRTGSGRFRPDPARKLSANRYDIYHCCVFNEKLLMMDRGTVRNV